MYLLGAHLPDHKVVRIALTAFYGISYATASRLCARLQLHEQATVASLSESQVAELSAYLSSPGSVPPRKPTPTSARSPLSLSGQASLSASSSSSSSASTSSSALPDSRLPPSQRVSPTTDPLRSLVLEADLRRTVQANIAHHRNVGSYVGRRHAAGLPVRGQRTRTNAQTAKKLNRVERRGFATYAPQR